MRYFLLVLCYASAESRDWGVGCIEARSSSLPSQHHGHIFGAPEMVEKKISNSAVVQIILTTTTTPWLQKKCSHYAVDK
jgi:hypothetical protein